MRDKLGRWAPGTGGNDAGRPPKYAPGDPLLLAMLDEGISIRQNGVECELTAEEVMLLRAIETVLKGKPGVRAIRMVLRAVVERELARQANASKAPPEKRKFRIIQQRDSDNAFEAMRLLGIAVPNPDYPDADRPLPIGNGVDLPNYSRILLAPWAVDAAVAREPPNPEDPDWSMKLNWNTAHGVQ